MNLPELYEGDCLEVMELLGAMGQQFDSCVCDPPYNLESIVKRFGGKNATPAKFGSDGAFRRAAGGFMGQTWDNDIAFRPETWAPVYDLLKPGAYLIAFSSSRTYHRMATAIEDAGFIIHPMIGWCFGTGMPKATRLKVPGTDGLRYGTQSRKPALEPICMAQKPMPGTGTANFLQFGTGPVDIDRCRVTWSALTVPGRWPANLIHDGSDAILSVFPSAPGQQGDLNATGRSRPTRVALGDMPPPHPHKARNDAGNTNAARFFNECPFTEDELTILYYPKASKDDRAGSLHPTVKPISLMRHLVRHVNPSPNSVTLDPFAGSGTTGEAAYLEGVNSVLIEREAQYASDIRSRISRLQHL